MDFLGMSSYDLLFIFYVIAGVISIIVFLVVLGFNMSTKNFQTTNLYFNALLFLQIIYVIFTITWAMGYFKIVPNYMFFLRYSKMMYFLAGTYVAFCWFMYVEIMMGAKFSRTKKSRMIIGIPILIANVFVVIISIVTTDVKITKNILVSISLMYIPSAYILFAAIYSLVMAIKHKNNRKRFITYGFFPVGLSVAAILQVLFLELPIYGLASSTLIVILFIYKIHSQVSIDPLTGINNRAALQKYVYEVKNKNIYVLMIDVDDFKSINDNFGHLEGDKALISLANTMKKTVGEVKDNCFLARYGGDEFIIIISSEEEIDIDSFVSGIEKDIDINNESIEKYNIKVSIGVSKVSNVDSIFDTIENADEKMYKNKRKKKSRR